MKNDLFETKLNVPPQRSATFTFFKLMLKLLNYKFYSNGFEFGYSKNMGTNVVQYWFHDDATISLSITEDNHGA